MDWINVSGFCEDTEKVTAVRTAQKNIARMVTCKKPGSDSAKSLPGRVKKLVLHGYFDLADRLPVSVEELEQIKPVRQLLHRDSDGGFFGGEWSPQ